MGRKADTHIRVTEQTWQQLNEQKRPGDSFDDVIQRLIREQCGDSSDGPADVETDGGSVSVLAD